MRHLHGIKERPAGIDLIIPQVNLSVRPAAYREYLDAHPRVVNRALVNVRRTTYSQNRVTRDDAYDGPVVVKTNANFGGLPEHRTMMRSPMPVKLRYVVRSVGRRIAQRLARGDAAKLAHADVVAPKDYRVFDSKRELPDAVFENDALIVERFRPERRGEQFISRNHSFLGSGGFTVWECSSQPLIRGDPKAVTEIHADDAQIKGVARSLGMEYGKLDYGMDENGELVLFDVNPTPCSNWTVWPEIKAQMVAEMAKGIFDWFPEMRERSAAG